MHLFHLDEIGNKNTIAHLRESFRNSHEVEAVLAGGINAMHDQNCRPGVCFLVNIDRNSRVLDGVTGYRTFPSIECLSMAKDFQSEETNQNDAMDDEKR